MKITKLFFLTIFSTILISILNSPKTLAHEYCESYLDCHQKPEHLEKVNYWTNYFFKLLRPEMRNKKVRIHHTLYRRERAEIRRVVNRVVYKSCQQPYLNRYYLLAERDRERDKRERWHRYNHREKPSHRLHDRDRVYKYSGDELLWDEKLWNEGYYWRRSEDYFFEGLYRDLTDAVFSARHPELSRRGSKRKTMNWSTEWIFIRQYFANFEQEQFLKQYLIPLCARSNH